MPSYNKVRGLTANDRSQSDKRAIAQNNSLNEPQYGGYRSSLDRMYDYGRALLAEEAYINENIEADSLANFKEKLDYDPEYSNKLKAEWIKNVANQVSPYYKKYNKDFIGNLGVNYITFNDSDWAEIASKYQAILKWKGGDEANSYLNSTVRENVAQNQSWGNRMASAGDQIFRAFASDVMTFAGMFYGAGKYALGFGNKVEGLSGFDNFTNNVMDNPVTRYADDFNKYGSFLFTGEGNTDTSGLLSGWSMKRINQNKELGIPDKPIVKTDNEENSLISAATFPEALGSYGYTLGSIVASLGTSSALSFAGNAVKSGATKAVAATAKSQARNALRREAMSALGDVAKKESIKISEDIVERQARMAVAKSMKTINTVGNATNAIVVPGLVGTTEGIMEGLNTKHDIRENMYHELDQKHSQEVSQRMDEIIKDLGLKPGIRVSNSSDIEAPSTNERGRMFVDKNGKAVYESDIRKQAESELHDKYEESAKQIEYAAAKGGVNNLYLNAAVNGFINATLHAGLQAPRVRASLESSKLTKWAQVNPKMNVTKGVDGVFKVNAKLSKWQKGYNLIKEPLGEGLEEMYQYSTDKMTAAGAEANIRDFIANKYDGDGTAKVGDSFGSEWANAWQALGQEAFSKEAFKAGIVGALGSAMGGVYVNHKTYTGKIDEQGNLQTTRWRKGLNAAGEKESTFEYLSRITPWRSGITTAIRDNRAREDVIKSAASSLEEWLNDPSNQEKYNSIVATTKWAEELSKAAAAGDEFGYRNSTLGKALNDAVMLGKLKGTQYYDSVLKQLHNIANISENSEDAQKLIEDYKSDPTRQNIALEDSEIVSTLKHNARKSLEILDRYQKESKKIELQLGDVDEDTKHSLIYGSMMLDNWEKRSSQLTAEIEEVKAGLIASGSLKGPNKNRASITDEQAKFIAEHGSLQSIKKQKSSLERRIDDAKAEIDDLTKKKSEAKLKEKGKIKARIEATNKVLEQAKSQLKEYDVIGDLLNSDENIVLSESEIMNLPNAARAMILKTAGEKVYNAIHGQSTGEETRVEESRSKSTPFSKSQMEVVNRLLAKINNFKTDQSSDNQESKSSKDTSASTIDKIIDLGRIESSIAGFQNQYIDVLTNHEGLQKFALNAKQAAKDALSAKRLESLERIENFSDFATEMDSIVLGNNQREAALIINALEKKNSFNYNKWKSSKGIVRDIYHNAVFNGTLEQLSENDAEIISAALDYLSNKGVDLTNLDEARLALTEMSGETSAFKLYLDKIYSDIPEASKPHISDINKVLDTYQEIIEQYNSDTKEKQKLNAKIEVDPNAPKAGVKTQAKPAITPTEESNDTSKDNAPSNVPAANHNGESSSTTNNAPEATPARSSLHDSSVASSSSTAELNSEVKDAIKTIEDLKKPGDSETNGIINTITKVVSNSKASDESKKAAAPLIKQAIEEAFEEIKKEEASKGESRQPMSFDEKKRKVEEKIANIVLDSSNINDAGVKTIIDSLPNRILNAQKEASQEAPKIGGSNFSNSSAPSIHRASIRTVDQSSFEGALKDFLKKYNANHFINSSGIIYEKDRPVYIIASGSLTNDVRTEMSNKDVAYKDNVHMPLILAIEHEDGNIEINGKKYQPLGVLPRSDDKNGLEAIRKNASHQVNKVKEEEFILVSDDSGEAFTTNFAKNPTARPADKNQREVLPVRETVIKDSKSDEDVNSSKYKSARRRFLENLFTRKNSRGDIELVYSQDRLKSTDKDNKETNAINIFVAPVGSTINVEGKSVLNVIQGNSSSIKDYNSRTRRATNFIEEFVKNIDGNEIALNSDKTLTSGAMKYLNSQSTKLHKGLSNFLSLPMDYSYCIVASVEDGDVIFKLGYAPSPSDIKLLTDMGHLKKGTSFIELNGYAYNVAEDYIKELLTQEGSDDNSREIRTFINSNEQTQELIKWQVPYEDMNAYKGIVDYEDKDSQQQALVSSVESIYDDNILIAPATSFDYNVTSLYVQGFNTTPIEPVVVGSNPVVPSANPNIDSGTGTSTNGSSLATPTKNNHERAVKLIDAIKGVGNNLKISDDEMFYIDSKGLKYIRVTSAIQADKANESDRMPKDSPWSPSSTTIGNDMGNLVRALFGSNLSSNSTDAEIAEFIESLFKKDSNSEKYKFKAIAQSAARAKARELLAIKDKIAQPGDQIIPYDITLTGEIETIDSDGNKHNAHVAGTVDILVLHADGSFTIYDIKTYRTNDLSKKSIGNLMKGIGEDRIAKYTRQLSLSRDLLLAHPEANGLTVRSLGIIAIGVDYITAKKAKIEGNEQSNYRVENDTLQYYNGKSWEPYTVESNQINVGGVIPITHVDHHILTEKLLEEERQLVLADAPADNSDLREIDSEKPIEFNGKPTVVDIMDNDAVVIANGFNGISNALLENNPVETIGIGQTGTIPVASGEESTVNQKDARADGETKEQKKIKLECSGQ